MATSVCYPAALLGESILQCSEIIGFDSIHSLPKQSLAGLYGIIDTSQTKIDWNACSTVKDSVFMALSAGESIGA